MKILFMCVANSARSQLAEGLAKAIFGSKAQIESAGSSPTSVNPLAIRALGEVGIDITGNRSKSVGDLPAEFVTDLNYVITLCAEEVCPVIISNATKLHWPHFDPAGGDIEKFREVREQISKKLKSFKEELGL